MLSQVNLAASALTSLDSHAFLYFIHPHLVRCLQNQLMSQSLFTSLRRQCTLTERQFRLSMYQIKPVTDLRHSRVHRAQTSHPQVPETRQRNRRWYSLHYYCTFTFSQYCRIQMVKLLCCIIRLLLSDAMLGCPMRFGCCIQSACTPLAGSHLVAQLGGLQMARAQKKFNQLDLDENGTATLPPVSLSICYLCLCLYVTCVSVYMLPVSLSLCFDSKETER